MIGYNPTNWASGDVITSEKLNKLEKGVANYSFEITLTFSNGNWTSSLSYDQIAAILDENDGMSRANVTVKIGDETETVNMLAWARRDSITITNTPYDDPESLLIHPQNYSEPKYIVYNIPDSHRIYKKNGVDVVEYTGRREYYAAISENPPE